MNDPMPPPVTLEGLAGLADLAQIAPLPRGGSGRSRHLTPGRVALAAALAGALAWRLAPGAIQLRHRRSRRPLGIGIATGCGLVALGLARWQLQRLFTPKPLHEVERKLGRLEVRRYPSVRIAETIVDASWDEALDQGFRRLAKFIFGGNDGQVHLRMAAPVIGTGDRNGFRLAFVLPDSAKTPVPNDPRIAVSDIPPRRIAVLRFHGPRDAHAIETQKRELAHELAKNGLKPHGEAAFAGYDPPSTLPILRRNELWIELDDQV